MYLRMGDGEYQKKVQGTLYQKPQVLSQHLYGLIVPLEKDITRYTVYNITRAPYTEEGCYNTIGKYLSTNFSRVFALLPDA